jgi:uncharacterized protein (TIGR00369 family)
MKNFTPQFIQTLTEKVNNSPFYELISMKLSEIAWGECSLEVKVQQKHLQPYGIVHGGVLASLVDAAAYWAVFTQIDAEAKMITVEIKVNYLAPASAGRLIAKGKSIKVGRTLCLGEAAIESIEGKILAHGTATMMVMRDLDVQGELDLPSRWIQP